MTRRCRVLHSPALVPALEPESSVIREQQVDLSTRLPVRAGWYRLSIAGLGIGEAVEARLDFGLGFVGHHSVQATVETGEAVLFVRLFKPLLGVQLLRRRGVQQGAAPQIAFERVPTLKLWWWRAAEQVHLLSKARHFSSSKAASSHDRPRRLWGWKGFQAFPAALRANGQSSYSLWRQVHCSKMKPAADPLNDWLVIIDCRQAEPSEHSFEAFRAAADYVGAKTFELREPPTNRGFDAMRDKAAWLVLVEPHVVLERDCVARFAAAADRRAAVIYSDNDHRDQQGRHCDPVWRTGFSSERLKSEDWLGGVVAFRSELLATCGAKDFSIWALSRTIDDNIGSSGFAHVAAVTYSSLAPAVPRPMQMRAFQKGWSGTTTVIIPTRNRADLLKPCVESVFASTSGRAVEIIIHDNGSDDPAAVSLLAAFAAHPNVRVVRDELPFNFSRINNDAVAIACGELLIFLNNDTEVASPDWLDRLAAIATHPSVGCVGPLLIGRDGRVQHAGLVTGPGGVAVHIHAGLFPEEVGSVAPIVQRDVSALTGACLVIEKSKFVAVGGFDSADLPVAFNDVDLCLRLERHALRNVFVPDAKLIHLGSATREADDFTSGSDRFRSEFRVMRKRWGSRLDHDPHFPEQIRLTQAGPQLRLA